MKTIKWTRGEHNSWVSLLPWLSSSVHVLHVVFILYHHTHVTKAIRHVGVDSRMILFGRSCMPTNDLSLQLSLQCDVLLIVGFVRKLNSDN